ncbi:hypothetical protein PRZ48_000941 [Zasmidium cellare]|uniref:Uncharacterized protein n=1 Tax=Zasmidium cellare TaxID=395010 RepID=A0ABR0F1F0_ZASCE|nr:hypothetical protein PRZ48_000941 [Zasmidium cellare]
MGFDTMRSFQHLGLNSSPQSPEAADDDSSNDNLRRQDSFMFSDSLRQRQVDTRPVTNISRFLTVHRAISATQTRNTSEAGRSIMRNKRPQLPVTAPPSFQATKAKWSPPASPATSSPTASPTSSPRTSSAQISTTSSISSPSNLTMSAKEKHALGNQLFDAACSGDLAGIQILLAQGAPINCSVLVGGLFESFKPAKAGHICPLAGAASYGQYDAAELLLAHNAELNPDTSQSASSPLHQAIRNNDLELVRFFLERGANVDINNSYKTTPLMYACKYGSPELVALLLKYKPDVNSLSFINAAAIHWSVWPSNTEITELLLKAKANPNHPMADGNTPLHCAIMTGSMDMTKTLLKYGADPLRRNENYETPLQMAEGQSNAQEIVALLEAAITART